MEDRRIINEYLNKYVIDNLEEETVLIIDTDNGYELDMGNSEVIYVEKDDILGWHCYGDIEDDTLANQIENDFEHFFESVNQKYYFSNI